MAKHKRVLVLRMWSTMLQSEHYHKVNESYKNVVDHCNWCSCSGAWVCHGCLRKIKHFASIEDKKRPVLAPKARRKSLPEENS